MAKQQKPTEQLPATEPGAAPLDPESTQLDPQPVEPEPTASDVPEEPAQASDASEPESQEPPVDPEAETSEQAAGQPIRCRVNWRFDGFRPDALLEGDEVETTEHEAAPWLGNVLTRLED